MSEYKSDPITDGRGMLSAMVLGTILAIVAIYITESNREDNFNKFKTSKNIYCPSSYKLVKGDGAFTFDRNQPLVLSKTNIVHQEDWYLYDDKGNTFNFSECVIRNK